MSHQSYTQRHFSSRNIGADLELTLDTSMEGVTCTINETFLSASFNTKAIVIPTARLSDLAHALVDHKSRFEIKTNEKKRLMVGWIADDETGKKGCRFELYDAGAGNNVLRYDLGLDAAADAGDMVAAIAKEHADMAAAAKPSFGL